MSHLSLGNDTRRMVDRPMLIGILMVVSGVLAIALPLVAAIAVNALLAWLLIISGCAHLLYGLHHRRAGAIAWEILLCILYAAVGIYLMFQPLVALAALALALAVFLFVEAVIELRMYFYFQELSGAGWLVFNGLVTFGIAILILASWPSNSEFVIGVLLGVSMLAGGVSRLMLRLAHRKLDDIVTWENRLSRWARRGYGRHRAEH